MKLRNLMFVLPNSPEFMEVYRFADEHGLPVMLTSEVWDQFPGYYPSKDFDAYFDMMEEVMRKFSQVRFIFPAAASSSVAQISAAPKYHSPLTPSCLANTSASSTWEPVMMLAAPAGRSEVSRTWYRNGVSVA